MTFEMLSLLPMLDVEALLQNLHEQHVAFVVIGGMAAIAQGSAYLTADLDICYSRDAENLHRLVEALHPLAPRLRVPGDQQGLPFLWDAATLRNGLNFTLTTTAGDLDLLGEVAGLGTFEQVRQHSLPVVLYDHETWVLGLDGLILAKEAAGREKDRRLLPELKALRALRRQQEE